MEARVSRPPFGGQHLAGVYAIIALMAQSALRDARGEVMAEERCDFCRLVRREGPVSCIYEDEKVIAFLDIRPMNEGHTLVIPKKYYRYIYEVPDEEIAHLFKVVRRVAWAVKKAVNAGGISITQHNESAAGQDVFHLHVHIIPRYEGQRLPRPDKIPEASREELDEVARKIRQFL